MYLVTGATGFIGKHLMPLLLARGAPVHVLVRASSRERLLDLAAARWGASADQVVPVVGDITQPECGIDEPTLGELAGKVEHVFHLAAIYALSVSPEEAFVANVQGSLNAVGLANRLGATLHYASSIAVAGNARGTWTEEMLEGEQTLDNPYFKSKFEAERLVRQEAQVPLRVYRPGVVIGSSETGEADRVDGPYYAFKMIQRIRNVLPPWVPLLGLEGGRLNLVPVDFVAKALDHIAHQEGLDGKTFHLVDPDPRSFGDAMNLFCKAAHAPQFNARIDKAVFNLIPRAAVSLVSSLPMIRSARREVMGDLGIPDTALPFINWRTKFDARNTLAALEGSGIACPRLEDYAWKIWDYWERQLDPDAQRDRSLAGAIEGKVIVITGASSGIGKTTSLRLAKAGATVLLVARTVEKLEAVRDEIAEAGGTAFVCPADLTDEAAAKELVAKATEEHGGIDILINNAGRSIRRSIHYQYDRIHDFERTMQINYFGALRLILATLPSMRKRKRGHIINISSIGAQTNVPRFSAYVASKAALDAFCRCISSEVVSDKVSITTIYMPLVRTPMIAPTKIYDAVPTLSPEEAVDKVVEAILHKPKRIATRLGTFAEVAYALAPKLVDRVLNVGYRVMPETPPHKKGEPAPEKADMSMEGVAFAHLLRGVHW